MGKGTIDVWLTALAAAASAGCTVGDGDGFNGINSGSASASASASAGTSEGNDDGSTTAGSDGMGTTAGGGADDTGGTASTSASADASDTDTGGSGATTSSESSSGGMVGACMGVPLDAQLEVPPLCAPTCTSIGGSGDCQGSEICRLKDSATAVCETCNPCGNLRVACSASSECDILFTCFKGQCTAMCDFNTPQTCGNPAACANVGHPTHGVCDPTL